ncbi:alpha/beta hydrolase [Blastococcus saxobsidens]|uniref:alpha/beta hydrolase n=1 Tax=Blastococcus saxobsidens TaxID=138336 RepID=UPI0031F32D40
MPTRRALLAGGAGPAVAVLLAGCTVRSPGRSGDGRGAEPARLSARPGAPAVATAPAPGTRALDLGAEPDPLLHVPPAGAAGRPLPLVVSLHGAGGSPQAGLELLRGPADELGVVVLAPGSRGPTWDAVGGTYGPDVARLDRALRQVFTELPVDPGRIGIAGFSDGASYALGLGLANGRLFSRVMAFSPGYVPPAPRSGTPEVFLTHGEDDTVLPVDRTSRRIVPALRDEGYDVTYREFAGPHTLPPELARAAVEWFARP